MELKYLSKLCSVTVQTGVILLVIYQLVTRYYAGVPVAYLPFEPPQFLRFISHRGLQGEEFRQVSVVRPRRTIAMLNFATHMYTVSSTLVVPLHHSITCARLSCDLHSPNRIFSQRLRSQASGESCMCHSNK
jgi:hypothetical protein